MFGFQRRGVRRCEYDTLLPKPGLLPQTSQTEATGSLHWVIVRLDIVPVRAGTVAEGYPTAGLAREPDAILAAAALAPGRARVHRGDRRSQHLVCGVWRRRSWMATPSGAGAASARTRCRR